MSKYFTTVKEDKDQEYEHLYLAAVEITALKDITNFVIEANNKLEVLEYLIKIGYKNSIVNIIKIK